MAPSKTKLAAWFPTAQSPVVISAPMLGVSNGTLSAHVSKAGGIGWSPLWLVPLSLLSLSLTPCLTPFRLNPPSPRHDPRRLRLYPRQPPA